MKKQILIISFIVIIVSLFVSCSVNSNSSNFVSTTVVTDAQGTTHYYEIVSDDSSTMVAEIVTERNGKAVTNKNGAYVTKEHTTILTTKRNNTIPSTSVKGSKVTTNSATTSDKSDTDIADNVVEFETTTANSAITTNYRTTTERKIENETTCVSKPTTKPTEKETTSVIESTTKVVTDKDGWIDKWY